MGLSDGEAWEKDFGENKDVVLVNVADMVNEKTGKTWREENLEKEHNIPLKSLVEVEGRGLRLYVVKYLRDCDGTPLYGLSADYDWGKINDGEVFKYTPTGNEREDLELNLKYVCSLMEKGSLRGGYSEESLKIIQTAEETAKSYDE